MERPTCRCIIPLLRPTADSLRVGPRFFFPLTCGVPLSLALFSVLLQFEAHEPLASDSSRRRPSQEDDRGCKPNAAAASALLLKGGSPSQSRPLIPRGSRQTLDAGVRAAVRAIHRQRWLAACATPGDLRILPSSPLLDGWAGRRGFGRSGGGPVGGSGGRELPLYASIEVCKGWNGSRFFPDPSVQTPI